MSPLVRLLVVRSSRPGQIVSLSLGSVLYHQSPFPRLSLCHAGEHAQMQALDEEMHLGPDIGKRKTPFMLTTALFLSSR